MVLSHRHKFIFFCNGKVASTSMRVALTPFQDESGLDIATDGLFTKGHIPPEVLRTMVPDSIWRQYFKFCFVRNPWDWVVSQYHYNFRGKSHEMLSQVEIRNLYHYLKRYRAMEKAASLFQVNYTHSSTGEQLVDYIGRFENIQDDFNHVMNTLGIVASLEIHNRNNNRKSYKFYYTDSTRELVAALYSVDVSTLGYSFEKRGE